MNYQTTANLVVKALGGVSNIASYTNCMTRLRVHVTDASLVEEQNLRAIEGVLGVVINGVSVQVVFGPGTVSKVAEAFGAVLNKLTDAEKKVAKVTSCEEKESVKQLKLKTYIQRGLKHIANIFVPLLPGIIAGGLINGITSALDVYTANLFADAWWYEAIRSCGWVIYAYLPVLVGMNASKEFKGSGVLGAVVGGLCVMHPAMPLVAQGGSLDAPFWFVSIPYDPTSGGIIAACIAGISVAFVERWVRTYVPDVLSTLVTPLVAVVAGALLTVGILVPFGEFVTTSLFMVLELIFEQTSVVGGFLLASTYLVLVGDGLHQVFIPIHQILNDPANPTQGINYLLPVLMMAGGGQVGAVCALYVKTRNTKLKNIIRASLPAGFLGVGEPLLYGVTLPLGKPFITACIGSGIGGAVAVLLRVGAISQGVSGLLGTLIIKPGTWAFYLVALFCSYLSGMLLTLMFGINEDQISRVFGGEGPE